jgi:intein/homing endonuclease
MTTIKATRILCYMDFMCPTGFGTVAHNVLDRLTPFLKANNIEVDVCALNYADNPHQKYNEQIMVINPKLFARNQDDFYWRDGVLKILQLGEYDLFWAMNDIPVISPMGRHLQYLNQDKIFKKQKPFKTLLYTPIDSQPYQRYFKDLELFDTIATYTEYGKKEIIDAYKVVSPHKKISVEVINHGIDKIHFKPLRNKKELRTKYNFPQDAFIWGNINKNQPRKDIGGTLIAFKHFKNWLKENHPTEKAVLYLHCYHSDTTGINLFVAIERCGLMLGEDIILPLEDKYVNNKYTTDEMNELYNCFDALVNTTMSEGWGLCLEANTLVETDNGLKKIKDLHLFYETQDKVLTNDGQFHKILDFTSRDVNEYYILKSEYNMPVSVTPEHPFFVTDGVSEPYWANVKELIIKPNMYVAMRKPTLLVDLVNKNHVLELSKELSDYNGEFYFENEFAFCKYGYSPNGKEWSISSIMKKYKVTKHTVEQAILKITTNKISNNQNVIELYHKLIEDGFKKNEPIKCKSKIILDEDLAEVCGWYLAEGSNEKGNRIEFSLNGGLINTKAIFIKDVLESKFGVTCVIEKNGTNKCRVRVSNKIIATLFGEYFGIHAENKKIPNWLYMNGELMKNVLKGYILGDGHIKQSNNKVSYTTKSPHLAFQLRSVLMSYNIMSSIAKTKRNCYCVIVTNDSLKNMKLILGNHIEFKNESTRRHKPKYIETPTHFFSKIKNVEFVELNEPTKFYDICVENEHSFTANGIVCHNTVTEAMGVGLPIVVGLHTSLNEITDFGKLVYGVDNFIEHIQISDAENLRCKLHPAQVCEKMVNAFEDRDKKINYINRYATKLQEYDWDKIATQFKKQIKKLIL